MISFQRLDQKKTIDLLAIKLLARSACFLPGDVFNDDLLLKTIEGETSNYLDAKDALNRIKSLGLISCHKNNHIWVHKLLSFWIKRSVVDNSAKRSVESAIATLIEPFSRNQDPRELSSWFSHLRFIVDQSKKDSIESARICNVVGIYLVIQGLFMESEEFFLKALGDRDENNNYCYLSVGSVMSNLGNMYLDIGRLDESEFMLRQSLKVDTDLFGGKNITLVETLGSLAGLLMQKGEYEEAEEKMSLALDISRSNDEKEHLVGLNLYNLSQLYLDTGRQEKAKEFVTKAMEIDIVNLGVDHPQVAKDMDLLAHHLLEEGQYTESAKLLSKALDIYKNVYGPRHPRISACFKILSKLKFRRQQFNESQSLMRQALAIDKLFFGVNSFEYTEGLSNFAEILIYSKSDLDDAESSIKESIKIRDKIYNEFNPYKSHDLSILSEVLVAKGKFEGAELMARRALEFTVFALGEDHPDVAENYNKLGHFLLLLNRYKDAENAFQKSVNIHLVSRDSNDLQLSSFSVNICQLIPARGRHSKAISFLENLIKIKIKIFGKFSLEIVNDLSKLSQVFELTMHHDKSEDPLFRALAIIRKHYEISNPLKVARTLDSLGNLKREHKRYTESEKIFRDSLDIYLKLFGENHPETGMSINNLAVVLLETNRLKEAEPLMRRFIEINSVLDSDHPNLSVGFNNLAKLLTKTGKLNEAKSLAEKALAMLEKSYFPDHPFVTKARNNYRDILDALNKKN